MYHGPRESNYSVTQSFLADSIDAEKIAHLAANTSAMLQSPRDDDENRAGRASAIGVFLLPDASMNYPQGAHSRTNP